MKRALNFPFGAKIWVNVKILRHVSDKEKGNTFLKNDKPLHKFCVPLLVPRIAITYEQKRTYKWDHTTARCIFTILLKIMISAVGRSLKPFFQTNLNSYHVFRDASRLNVSCL